MKFSSRTVMGIFACMLVLVFTAAPAAARVTMKVAHPGSPEHQFYFQGEQFMKILEESAPGEFKVKMYPHSQLGGEREMVEQCSLGTVDMVIVSTGTPTHWVKEIGAVDIPYIFKSRDRAYASFEGKVGAVLREKMLKHGMRILSWSEVGIRHLTNNVRPVKVPEDTKGLKIRVMESVVYIEMLKSWGAVATPMAFHELYTALQQHVVDGQENPTRTIRSMKFYEVQKHLSLTGHVFSPGVTMVNEKFYQKLPDKLKKALAEAADKAARAERKFVADNEENDLEFLKSQGMIVSIPDVEKFRQASRPVVDIMAKKVGWDIIKMIQSYQQ
ncbi:MAG: DctP family TRAP transporter solute-binding subunit [Deltaproteobacteria bacterium]|nr:DctP family TRAP transporter solute-binding subunit [Deltaproteobacteria bacterium]